MDYNKDETTRGTDSGTHAPSGSGAAPCDVTVDYSLQQVTFPGEVRLTRADLERALTLLNTPPKRPTLNTKGVFAGLDTLIPVNGASYGYRQHVSIANRNFAEYADRGLYLSPPPEGTRWAVVRDSDDCDVLTLVDA